MAKKDNKEEAKEINWVKEIVGMLIYIAFVFLAVWFIITFVGQRTEVSGESMCDTLYDEDNLWVSKISYRLHDPERFDIVVFPAENNTTYYIKRIIALPGEKIRIDEEGKIYINDEVLEENYGKEVIEEDLVGRAYENVTLGDDEYFVMGDNRNRSLDSREEEVGNIKREDLKGKAVLRIWPLNRFGTIK
ncbi:MAG: signal peptidase I [Eubacteriales bacterium]|nr:signal peptidase I [Eubacteriales bacterium]